jgi:hypothetical protein
MVPVKRLMIARKMYGFGNGCKFLSIKVERRHGGALINVLTAKMGRFLAVLAEKRGVRAKKMSFYFGLFRFLGSFLCGKPLMASNLQNPEPSRKNRAQKPTVGFLFLAGYCNIVA